MLRWLRRKPIIRYFAKKRFICLQKKYQKHLIIWQSVQSSMNLAKLRIWKAKLFYYQSCFYAWGKYRPEFSFNEKQHKEYEAELKELNMPVENMLKDLKSYEIYL